MGCMGFLGGTWDYDGRLGQHSTGQCRIPTTDCEKDQLLEAGLGEKEIQMLHYRCNAH